ncbi:MAG: DNA-3-methyladenine glycosylase family protein [Actinomycetota bacterium]
MPKKRMASRAAKNSSWSSLPDLESWWRPGRPVDIPATLGTLIRGAHDPTHRWASSDLWRVCRTPLGPVTLLLRHGGDGVFTQAWGPGSAWALDALPALLGADDDEAGFSPDHPLLIWALRRRPGWRVPRTQLVMEALVPAIIEQKVTGYEAFGSWSRLLGRFGDPAPGPPEVAGMRVPLSPQQWARIASWEWLQAGVDRQRSDTVARAVQSAHRLEQTTSHNSDAVERLLRAIPGVGVWTAAEVRHRAHGDANAVSFGDFHIPRDIGRALTGTPVDDAGLQDLLAPYQPHRYRIQRLVQLEAPRRVRRTPRPTPRWHLPVS